MSYSFKNVLYRFNINVRYSSSLKINSKPLRNHLKHNSKFLDSLRIHVKGGTGGFGYPKYGGLGGKGGDVCLVATEGMTLKEFLTKYPHKKLQAETGGNSHSRRILGLVGQEKKVNVPIGISVYDDNNRLIGDLNEDKSELIVAKGGEGGCKVNGFCGKKGESRSIKLELKLIADVGLVGFPNAGKSTLLKSISNAKTKIASYPFTTLRPNIGIMSYKDLRQISMADLPGLIEGAHCNIGMGHRFLRHVERTKLLLLVVDINGFQLSPLKKFRSCLDTIVLLNKELELYKEDLLEKPAMLLINKMDTEGAKEKYLEIQEKIENLNDAIYLYPEDVRPKKAIKFDEILPISAKNEPGDIEYVKTIIRDILDIKEEINNVTDNKSLNKLKDSLRERGPVLV
ncbi:GTP-binding protein 10 homolog [Daktulosphaira vitifoliae]|uniref:GTP-binding protein 10 homolog n=1 Tax=Daktulosphaira vitifoliae TaxID=58002 RepID=UPI0021AB030D|nr:GTP-binding protein 10 homolog [Daktulosphaira vitifoliae]